MGDRRGARKWHTLNEDTSKKKALINNDLVRRRREKLTARARALYDEALEHGLTGQYSAHSETILSRMGLLTCAEKQKLTELFDATSLGVETILLTKTVDRE